MNTRLEKLFLDYEVSTKDKRDFLQIYELLPSYKKVRFIENFDDFMAHIQALRDDLYHEQELLFGKSLENIESHLREIKKAGIAKQSKFSIDKLRASL